MAKLKVIDSGSSGNCYLLETDTEVLILEAGLPYSTIQKGINFDFSKVVGCLISHEHSDHIKSAEKLLSCGIKVFASAGTFESKNIKNHFCKVVKHLETFTVGGFKVIPLTTEHDATEPLGFVIDHKEIGRLLFATDTYYFKYRIDRINHYLIECNYQLDILNKNKSSSDRKVSSRAWSTAKRLLTSHFELGNVCKYLSMNIDHAARNILLLHRSSMNSDKDTMLNDIKKTIDNNEIHVGFADPGIELDVSSDF